MSRKVLNDYMEYVIQQYLRNQYHTIDEYNRVAGEIAEPYRILVVVGFPANFSKEAANQLTNIAVTGPRCGVYVLMTVDTEHSLPPGFKANELERVARVIAWNGQSFTWQHEDISAQGLQLDLDTLPRPAIFDQLLQRIGDELEFYLIDFKTVGFTPYAQHKLLHARVVAIQSEREFGLSVLEGLNEELEQRKRLFSKAGVQDITQFRRVQPRTRMPRILLVIDEFQELFMHTSG